MFSVREAQEEGLLDLSVPFLLLAVRRDVIPKAEAAS